LIVLVFVRCGDLQVRHGRQYGLEFLSTTGTYTVRLQPSYTPETKPKGRRWGESYIMRPPISQLTQPKQYDTSRSTPSSRVSNSHTRACTVDNCTIPCTPHTAIRIARLSLLRMRGRCVGQPKAMWDFALRKVVLAMKSGFFKAATCPSHFGQLKGEQELVPRRREIATILSERHICTGLWTA
jgi:hypothetical protein